MDDGLEQGRDPASIGERLRLAREERGMSLDDVANQTRIPIRHLQHIEQEEWTALPGVTYCIGFARSYANMIGLDGAEIGRELRDQIGGTTIRAPAPQYYEPADPARVPPRSLALIAGIVAVVGIVLYVLWRSSLGEEPAPVASATSETPVAAAPATTQAPPAAAPQASAGQPVTLTATQEVWLRITDAGGGPALFNGIMAAGQTFQVPPTAQRPVIRTARPQVLRVTIGANEIGPLEPVERSISDVSLRAEDLVARQQAAAQAPAPATPPAPAQ
jgi:cytoskeletal protein RodZ